MIPSKGAASGDIDKVLLVDQGRRDPIDYTQMDLILHFPQIDEK